MIWPTNPKHFGYYLDYSYEKKLDLEWIRYQNLLTRKKNQKTRTWIRSGIRSWKTEYPTHQIPEKHFPTHHYHLFVALHSVGKIFFNIAILFQCHFSLKKLFPYNFKWCFKTQNVLNLLLLRAWSFTLIVYL